jgi:hypothetical protein
MRGQHLQLKMTKVHGLVAYTRFPESLTPMIVTAVKKVAPLIASKKVWADLGHVR